VKAYSILLSLILTTFLTSCSLNEGTEKLYRKENVLQIEMILPIELEIGKEYEFQAVLTHADGKVPEIKNITFKIWKNGKKTTEEMVPQKHGIGRYRMVKTFLEEGLYFVKVEANTKDSTVMPTKQFTVGSFTEEDLKSLPNQMEEHHHEGHH
jgi:hypothetical protein